MLTHSPFINLIYNRKEVEIMIIRPLTLTVNDDRATLSEGVTLYLGDYGICLEIQLKTVKYGFNGGTTHYESIEYADSCDVYVRRPSGDTGPVS